MRNLTWNYLGQWSSRLIEKRLTERLEFCGSSPSCPWDLRHYAREWVTVLGNRRSVSETLDTGATRFGVRPVGEVLPGPMTSLRERGNV